MTVRRIGIPAVPPGLSPEMSQFLSSMRQELLRQDREMVSLSASLESALKQGAANAYNRGIITTGVLTPDPAQGVLQVVVNNGAFTLAPPSDDGFVVLAIYEGASAGAITTSAWDEVTGTYSLHAANTVYFARMTRIRGVSHVEFTRIT
jgi:hypothetical protein